jgi:predicted ATPase/DNA-binding SARP family transcriptional activator
LLGFVVHVTVGKLVNLVEITSARSVFRCAGANFMSILKIKLLGQPEVSHFDRRLTFPDRKVLALLTYLATEGGMHERQRLSRMFWPESDSAHGRTALRISLHHLRRALEEGAQPEHESHLLILHDALGLNIDSGIDLDLNVLQAAWSLARDQAALGEVQGEMRRMLIARLQDAAALYRNGFLEDFTLRDTVDFDNWVGIQRGYWYQRIEQVLDWLSQMQSAEGEIEQAIATVERWRSFDPLNEDISLRLMQLYFATGNRVAALRTYETYQNVLMKELSVTTSPHIAAQAEFIRNATAPRSRPTREQIESHPSSMRSLLEVPFVGRGAEFNRLMSLYQRVSDGQPQVVVIEGEAGIGKSRLAAEFLAWARAQGAEVLEGRAFKSYQRLAYQPILEPLRSRLAKEYDLRQLLSDPWLAELSRLLPELRERYPELPPPTIDEAFDSSRFFEALAHLGEAYAAHVPLLIFVDDLQWTDKATLDLFQYLGRQWAERSTPVLLLLSRRVETRSMDSWLVEWLAYLKRDVSLTRLELGPLSAINILQIAQSVAGEDSGPQAGQREHPALRSSSSLKEQTSRTGIERFGAWLFAETQGQPLFVRATLEVLLERGGLAPRLIEGKGWVFEPQSSILESTSPHAMLSSDVREMIQFRLSQLSPSARELLAAGAVLDKDFTFEALCQVAHLNTQDGLFALDEATESLLLQESPRQNGKGRAVAYMFVHDKFREVAYVGAGDARRRIYHGRALQFLEREGASAAILAYHALASGSAELAFRWSMAAGDEAMTVFAVRDAIGHYEQARQLADQHKIDVTVTSRHHLSSQLGRAYEIRNDARAAQAIYQTMLETARRMHDAEMECVALNRQAVLEGEDFFRLDRAIALLQQALKVAERNQDRSCLAETYWSLARVNYYALNMEASLDYGRQAYALALELDKPDLMIRVLNILSYTTKALGQWEEAASRAEEAWQLAAQQGNRVMEADCLARVADARINFGQPVEGVTAARAAYAISLEIEHTWSRCLSGYTLARGLVEIGSYEEALTIALASTEAARTLTFSILLIVNLLTLGIVYQALLLPEKALQTHLEALKLAESVSAKRYIAMSASLLCAVSVFAEDWEGAFGYARRALAARDPHEVIFAETPRWPETVALLYAGESEQASKDLHHFREHFGANKRCCIVLARALAVLAQPQGGSKQAITYVREAIAGAEEIGLPGEHWQAEAALGELYLAHGEREQARQAFTRAATAIQQLAGNINNDKMRTQFLAAAPVRDILTRT